MQQRRDNLAEDWPPLRTITDLALRFWNVRLRCPRCQHERIVSGAGLWWLFQRRRWFDDSVQRAARRLYCSLCHHRYRRKVVPWIDKTKDPPTGQPLLDPPEHEWKRLIARYRS